MKGIIKLLKHLYSIFINILSFLYLIFDEIFSYFSSVLSISLSKIPKIQDVCDYCIDILKNQNRYLILCILIILIAISEYVGILSLMLFGTGHIFSGIIFYILKFIPFFLMSSVFKHTKDELLRINWFAFCYYKFEIIREYLKNTAIYKQILDIKNNIYRIINKIKEIFKGLY